MNSTPQFHREHNQLIVSLTGAMTFRDYATADELLAKISDQLKPDGTVPAVTALVFDLSAVTMIDSHWLGLFVRALKRAEEAAIAVIIRGAQPAVRRLLDLVQFERVFRIEA